jgi:hypothetical protein
MGCQKASKTNKSTQTFQMRETMEEQKCSNCKWWESYKWRPGFGDCLHKSMNVDEFDVECDDVIVPLDGMLRTGEECVPLFGKSFYCKHYEMSENNER